MQMEIMAVRPRAWIEPATFLIKTNLMHYLSSIYFVKQLLRVSGVFTAHHQEVFTLYVQQLVRVVRLGDWQLVGSGWNARNM
jgi:hypothetical protein